MSVLNTSVYSSIEDSRSVLLGSAGFTPGNRLGPVPPPSAPKKLCVDLYQLPLLLHMVSKSDVSVVMLCPSRDTKQRKSVNGCKMRRPQVPTAYLSPPGKLAAGSGGYGVACILPPHTSSFSTTHSAGPRLLRKYAAKSPPGPPPTMSTLHAVSLRLCKSVAVSGPSGQLVGGVQCLLVEVVEVSF